MRIGLLGVGLREIHRVILGVRVILSFILGLRSLNILDAHDEFMIVTKFTLSNW